MGGSMDNKEVITFYADKEGNATVVCPACGYAKTVNAYKANIARKELKTKCKCDHVFRLIIEIRTIYRKEVNLTGQCEHLKTKKREVIQIADISMDSIGIKHPSPIDIAIGDRLKIAFRLDNAMNSKINLLVEVKRISGPFVGGIFVGPKPEPALGFYLQT